MTELQCITSENVSVLAVKHSHLFLLADADWCEASQLFRKVVDEVRKECPDQFFWARIQADKEEDFCNRYGVQAVPSLLIFLQGSLFRRMVGYKSKEDLISQLADVWIQ
ncbi:thioredoxin family protein [Alicyclobacillus sp. TC]|uniref:thioredoxin family protein n=1 Tax=Alicyclobacillus sp. TC TaxID=2606450 RepID=UPI00193351D2|nr:thioredoxin family protein [Alicyclobacillus sp. TC]QRF23076.1 thioredoxin family protein [Alicyclobacillus sp. TC]